MSEAERLPGCSDCWGTGWRTGRSLRRTAGRLVEREAAMACACPRGHSYLQSRDVVSVADVVAKMRSTPTVTRASGHDGLLGWAVTDRAWTRWSASLYVDEDGARTRQATADATLAGYLAGSSRRPSWARDGAARGRDWSEEAEDADGGVCFG